jgi:hypothetical protein
MIKKEWFEVSKQSLYSVLVIAGLLLMMGLANWLQDKPQFEAGTVLIILGFMLLMFSMFLGLSPFALDSKQKGMEYLLTLPFSRRRLLFIKLLPRLAAVILFYLAFIILYGLVGNDAIGGGFAFFSLAYFALFFISYSLSAVDGNFIVQSLWAGIAWCGYLALCLFIIMLGFSWKFGMPTSWVGSSIWHDLSYDVPTLLAAIAVFFLMAVPFILSIFLAFKKFDLKPARAFNRRQLFFFMPLLLLAFTASLGLTYAVQQSAHSMGAEFFLLENNRLLKADFPGKLALYDEQGQSQVETGKKLWWEWMLFETPEKAFMVGYDVNDSSTLVVRLGLKDLACQVVHLIPAGFEATPGGLFRQCGQELVFLQRGQGNGPRSAPATKNDRLDLVMLDMNSEHARTISFQSPLFSGCINPHVFAHDEANSRSFWLVSGKDGRERHIFRLWADGTVEDLGVSKKFPAYFGRLLFTHSAGSLLVRRLTSGGDETIGEVLGAVNIANDFLVGSLDTVAAREVFGTRNKRLIRIDLENLVVDDLGPEHGRVVQGGPIGFYYVEYENWPGRGTDKWRKVFRLKGKERAILRQFDFNGKWPGNIWMQRNGIILREERKNSFFAFPDLKKLEFEGVK